MDKIGQQRNFFIDVLRVFFSIFIITFHINFGGTLPEWISCVARLGVPFFFVITGYFFSTNSSYETVKGKIKKYIYHSIRLFFVWYLIYFVFIFKDAYIQYAPDYKALLLYLLQRFVFLPPCYLWYLSAGIVGALIFAMLFRYKKIMVICAICVYILGTLGNSYLVFFPEVLDTFYYEFFLTTRNGLFFAFPMMVVGYALHKVSMPSKNKYIGSILSISALLIYILEYFLINKNANITNDTSMYFSLPLITFCLVNFAINNPYAKMERYVTKWKIELSKISIGVYVMQYGWITVLSLLGINRWLLWLGVSFAGVCASLFMLRINWLKKVLL